MITSSRVGQCATKFRILTLFISQVNEAACPPVSTVYSPIMPSEGIYNACSLTRLSVLNESKINMIKGIDTISRVEKLPAEHGLSC